MELMRLPQVALVRMVWNWGSAKDSTLMDEEKWGWQWKKHLVLNVDKNAMRHFKPNNGVEACGMCLLCPIIMNKLGTIW